MINRRHGTGFTLDMSTTKYQPKMASAIFVGLILSTGSAAAETEQALYSEQSERADSILMLDDLKSLFEQGLDLPIVLVNKDAETVSQNPEGAEQTQPEIEIGHATISYFNKTFYISDIKVESGQQGVALSQEVKAELEALDEATFDKTGKIALNKLATLDIDYIKMNLRLLVSEESFGLEEEDPHFLGEPTHKALSGIAGYNINAFTGEDTDTTTSLNFNTVTSYGEHHLYMDGVYFGGGSDSDSELGLEQLVYERDFQGRRISAGLMENSSLQTLSSISTLESQRVFGFSYGNSSSSRLMSSGEESLVPINLYFPSSGEARVFRNGRLINIQQFPLGLHKLDTTQLPGGIYNVKVDVVVGGKVYSSRTYRVNKAKNSELTDNLQWEFWGGISDSSDLYSSSEMDEELGKDPVVGLSLASRIGDLEWNSSFYKKGDSLVQEGTVDLQLTNNLQMEVQDVIANDGSRSLTSHFNLSLPYDIGDMWLDFETGKNGSDKGLDTSFYKRQSIGADLYLGNFIPSAGVLSVNYEKSKGVDEREYSRTSQVSYNQFIYEGEFGTVDLYAGYNHQEFENDNSDDLFVTLRWSLPLNADFTLGASQQQGGHSFDFGVATEMDGFVNSVGVDMNRFVDDEQGRSDSYNAYANYAGQYAQGTVTLQGSDESSSASITNQGSVAWNRNTIAVGGDIADAGVVLDLPETVQDGDLELVVNDQPYPLYGGRNLVALPSFGHYSAALRNTYQSDLTYDTDLPFHELTLYPGNVVSLTPEIKSVMTVFGRLVDENGKPIDHALVENQANTTETDPEGYFSLDINLNLAQLVVTPDEGQPFMVDLVMKEKPQSVVWLGNIKHPAQQQAFTYLVKNN